MIIVEKIAPYHAVNSFTCGTRRNLREMNDFLRKHGSDRKFGTTFVVVPYAGSPEVIAYFTVSPDPDVLLRLPPNSELNDSLVHLLYLAAAEAHQKQGIGEQILVYLIEKVLSVAQVQPELTSLELSALDEIAKS